MGAEESKSHRPREQNVSKEEVRQLLEQQRKEYERKLKELQIRTSNSANSKPPTETARDASTPKRNIDQILGQQLQEFAHIAYNAQSTPSTSSTQRFAAKPNAQSPNSLNPSTPRPATRYSYTSDELRNIQFTQASQQQVYPQLDTLNLRATPVPLDKRTAPSNNNKTSPSGSDFVFVNKNENASQSLVGKPEPSSTLGKRPAFGLGKPGPSSVPGKPEPSIGPGKPGPSSVPGKPEPSIGPGKPGPSSVPGKPEPSIGPGKPGTSSLPGKPERSIGPGKTGPSSAPDHINKNSNPFRPTPSTSRAQPSAPPESALSPTPSTSKTAISKPQANKKKGEVFNCITCGNPYGLNIYQCSIGHSSCRECKLRSALCGICKKSIGDIRNITLEALVAEVKLTEAVAKAEAKQKCPNHGEGCNYYCKILDMDKHLQDCPFREFACPIHTLFGQCNWRGRLSQMAIHFNDIHPENCQGNVDTEMYLINVVDSNHNVYFIELSPYNFLVHLKVDENERKVFMAVQLLGTHVSASKWTYELQVYNKREPRRKYMHSDVCHSDAVPIQEIFNDMKCATLPLAYALTFINEGCMTYKFYIKKEVDDSSSKGKFKGRGRGRGRGAKGNVAN